MSSLQEKVQSIKGQGVKKITAMLHMICFENEELKKKLLGTKEEQKEAREDLLSFASLLSNEIKKACLETGKSQREVIEQVIKEAGLTAQEAEKVTAFNQLILHCQQTTFQEPGTEKKKNKKFKA